MILFAIALLCLSSVVALVSGLWTLALAFQRDVKWGLAVLLVPPFGNLAFLCVDWREARVPFFIGLASLFLMGSALFTVPRDVLPFQSAITAAQSERAERAQAAEGRMLAERESAAKELKLIHLKRAESALLDRKARVAAGDQAAAEALSGEIRKYNAELNSALAQAGSR
jgi:hypothetical protein